MLSRRAFLLGAVATAGCRRKATGFPGYAFVANRGENSVAAVDCGRFAVARRIPLPAAPEMVLANAPRETVYALAPASGTLFEIGIRELTVQRKLELGRSASSIEVSNNGQSLWVVTRSPNALVRVAVDSFQITSRVRLPSAPESFAISQDATVAAVSLAEARSVAIVDLVKSHIRAMSPADDPHLVCFRSDARQILVANRSKRMLRIADAATGSVLVDLPLPIEPEHFCMKADGGQLFITGKGMDAVVVVYPYQTEVAETKLAGRAPRAMAISPSQQLLFTANPEPGDVTVIEMFTHDVIAAVKVGQDPCFVTFTPDDQYALVVNRGSGDLAVIRTAAIRQSRSKIAPLFTMIPVGLEPVSAAVCGV